MSVVHTSPAAVVILDPGATVVFDGLCQLCVPGEAFHPRAVVATHLTITPKLLFLASPGAIPTAGLEDVTDYLFFFVRVVFGLL